LTPKSPHLLAIAQARSYRERVTEVPDADRAEQSTRADREEDEPDTPTSAPIEANEADVAEQSIPVPIDDDYR
jgi:hypothetical protein